MIILIQSFQTRLLLWKNHLAHLPQQFFQKLLAVLTSDLFLYVSQRGNFLCQGSQVKFVKFVEDFNGGADV